MLHFTLSGSSDITSYQCLLSCLPFLFTWKVAGDLNLNWNWNLDLRLNLNWKVTLNWFFFKCLGSPCYLILVSGGSFLHKCLEIWFMALACPWNCYLFNTISSYYNELQFISYRSPLFEFCTEVEEVLLIELQNYHFYFKMSQVQKLHIGRSINRGSLAVSPKMKATQMEIFNFLWLTWDH